MRFLKKILFFAFLCCFTTIVFAQNITIDDTKTAQELVENVLVNSSCVTVLNSSVNGDTFTSGKNSYGYFNSGTSSFPFSEGVILNTWSIENSIGPFIKGDNGGGSTFWLGDADLDQAIGIHSINATSLEFDFTPLTNFISFDYIFASNEYQGNYPCNFSDGFAFLIKEKGSAANYQNLAVLPSSTIPVSSVNIHPIIPSSGSQSGCPAVNESYFNGFNVASSPINYGGQTVVMNAQTNVVAGTTYHIKLVIADDQTRYFDSAVFLQAGSFSPKINLGQDRLLATNNPICYGESYIIDTNLPATYSYKWFKDGIEIPSETGSTLVATDTGIYKVEVIFTPATCMATGEIKLEYTPEIVLSNATLIQCDDNGDGKTIFDLTKLDTIIKNNDPSLSPVVYYESLPEAKSQINPIANFATYQNTLANPPLFARVSNSFGCANYAQVDLVIANNAIAPQNPVPTCDGDDVQDGLYHFDLNAQVTPQVLTGLPSGLIIEYYLIPTDAVSQKNPLPNIFDNTLANQQTIYARIVNGPDCYGIVPITLVVNTFDPPNFQDETAIICTGSSTTLSVSSNFSSYLWNTGDTSNSIMATTSGNYSVLVTDVNGCTKTKKFVVEESGIATITGATVNDFAGNGNSVLIQYTGTGIGNYEFSLDGFYFQDNPLFTGIASGNYFAYARDKNGCGLSIPYTIYVLDYPRFFTPNGDGYNDVWEIKNFDKFPNATITIYDRYGKLLKEFSAINPSWNGTYIGQELPADDYWFNLNLGDGKIIKGHFSLKR
ncbi:MAG: choice-of-anchor L domain-containing protein [Flavobacterium sp.]|uniref:T9SS type B sorting domain-containing protein n=1 Tax=Flavobacterium sp. TaxID=239 RepID=UPI002606A388|nr:choice-of-anchor L domain-containing protein [Flavobacterium sp.]MDD5149885.1 choice-of-anchor L domain-containing protein [Flavobacterium sp.]